MPKQRIQRVADKIRRENSDRESASPFSSSRKSNCRETTRHSDRCHQRDRRAASDFLELNACLWLQAPDRFQKTPGKASVSMVTRQTSAPAAKKITSKILATDRYDWFICKPTDGFRLFLATAKNKSRILMFF
jgi:hypothetical protein